MSKPLFKKFGIPSLKTMSQTANKIERALAEELRKLDHRLVRNKDSEFEDKLKALIAEYGVADDTILAALERMI